MPSKITHDVVATVREYTDRDGSKKKQYLTVGKVFTGDDGRMSIKMDAIPVTPEWSGWLSLYPIDREPQRPQRAANQDRMPPGRQQQHTMPPSAGSTASGQPIYQGDLDPDDDIPF